MKHGLYISCCAFLASNTARRFQVNTATIEFFKNSVSFKESGVLYDQALLF
jgi:hypothetical protein